MGHIKYYLWVGWAAQPGILGNFLFKLTSRPSGIAQRNQVFLRSVMSRDRGEDILGGGDAKRIGDLEGCLPVAERGVKYKSTFGLDRAALEYGLGGNQRVGGFNFHVPENLTECHIKRPIDNDPHCTIRIVLTDISYCMEKVWICQPRHGD